MPSESELALRGRRASLPTRLNGSASQIKGIHNAWSKPPNKAAR